jgi:hypothetical protein
MDNPYDSIVKGLASLRAGLRQESQHAGGLAESGAHAPFVTISRQAGAGGRSFAVSLAARLNAIDAGALPWTVWDNELVTRIANQWHLRPESVAAIEEQRPNWLEEALASLLSGNAEEHSEVAVFHHVASAIRALAEMGRVIIVGRGGAFVTEDLPGGVHLRLVAPLQHRVEAMARARGISMAQAAKWVRETDHNRDAFCHRHWPGRTPGPEAFTATFNTARSATGTLVEAVLPLVLNVGAVVAGTTRDAVPK